jgi:hypothetical protein
MRQASTKRSRPVCLVKAPTEQLIYNHEGLIELIALQRNVGFQAAERMPIVITLRVAQRRAVDEVSEMQAEARAEAQALIATAEQRPRLRSESTKSCWRTWPPSEKP